jgi:hypothetical protein
MPNTKIAVLIFLLFAQSISAQCIINDSEPDVLVFSDPSPNEPWNHTDVHAYPEIKALTIEHRYTHANGMLRTHSHIDSTGKMTDFKAFLWDKKMCLVQVTINSKTFYIAHGNTPCNFTIIDSSGDSASFNSIPYSDLAVLDNSQKLSDEQLGRLIILSNQAEFCEKYKKTQKKKDGKK